VITDQNDGDRIIIEAGLAANTASRRSERAVKHDRAVGRAALVVVTDFGAMEIELTPGDVASFNR
jgi:hypothetical protein